MAKYELIGEKFGRLTVLKEADRTGRNEKYRYWKCICDCGGEKVLRTASLINGNTKSCGCMQKEIGPINLVRKEIHGMCGQRIHTIWRSMRQRCRQKNAPYYKYYGGRGIKCCERWDSFENFRDDMFESYQLHYKENNGDTTLDRKDVNGNYEPSNCRWITEKEQHLNMTNNHILEIEGVKKTIKEWSDFVNINRGCIQSRIDYGYTGIDLIQPVMRSKWDKGKFDRQALKDMIKAIGKET